MAVDSKPMKAAKAKARRAPVPGVKALPGVKESKWMPCAPPSASTPTDSTTRMPASTSSSTPSTRAPKSMLRYPAYQTAATPTSAATGQGTLTPHRACSASRTVVASSPYRPICIALYDSSARAAEPTPAGRPRPRVT